MVNYNNSIIYKIVCKDINVKEIYVGSTTNFNRRKQGHKFNYNNSKRNGYKVYQYIINNQGWDNFDMILVEKYECNDKLELLKRERYWIETLGATLNKIIPTRSDKEYREQNKEKISKRMKEYRNNNQEKIRDYFENNKEALKAQRKEHYEKSKEIINDKRRETGKQNKIVCNICNKEMRRDSLLKHNKRFHN